MTSVIVIFQVSSIILISLVQVSSTQVVPALFVFGDSLVDAGNNDYIPVTLAKANFPPNGIDFGRPTGRFTNGKTTLDILGQELGFEDFPPPYYAPSAVGNAVLHGVNYASAAAGILRHSGYALGGRVSMDEQLDNFAKTRQDIITTLGAPSAMELMSRSIFSITIGANDFINNYLVPIASLPEQKLVPPETFVDSLIATFRNQLTRLYDLGARKISVSNVGPIGCIPSQMELNLSDGDDCVAFPNQLAISFNARLKLLITELNANFADSIFVYCNVYDAAVDIVQSYKDYGFENFNSACCRAMGKVGGRFGGLLPCWSTNEVCPDRSKYVFWDAYHTTEAANIIIARRLLDGNSEDSFPINFRQLAHA